MLGVTIPTGSAIVVGGPVLIGPPPGPVGLGADITAITLAGVNDAASVGVDLD